MKITSKKLPFSFDTKIRPLQKIDGTEEDYQWEEVDLKINFENINEGTVSINSPNTYTYAIEKGVNYFLVFNHRVNYDTKKQYNVVRDVWSENIEKMKILKDVNVVRTSKEDVVRDNITTVVKIDEPTLESERIDLLTQNIQSVDTLFSLYDQVKMFVKNNFFSNSNSLKDLRLYTGNYRQYSTNKFIIKSSRGIVRGSQMDSLVNIFDNWTGASVSGYARYKNYINKWKNLLLDVQYKFDIYNLNKSNAFQTSTKDYYIITRNKDLNLVNNVPFRTQDIAAYTTETDKLTLYENLDLNMGNLLFVGYTTDDLTKTNSKISKAVFNYSSTNYDDRGTHKYFNGSGEVNMTNNIITPIIEYGDFIRPENYYSYSPFPQRFKLPDKWVFNDIPDNASFIEFKDMKNNNPVYMDIEGKFFLIKNLNVDKFDFQVKPTHIHLPKPKKQIDTIFYNKPIFNLYKRGDIITDLYYQYRIYLYNNFIQLPSYTEQIQMELFSSEGVVKSNTIEKVLKINYKYNDLSFDDEDIYQQKILNSTESKTTFDNNLQTRTQLYYQDRQNKVLLNNLQRQIETAENSRWQTGGNAALSGAGSFLGGALAGGIKGGAVAGKIGAIGGAILGITGSLVSGIGGMFSINNQIKSLRENQALQEQVLSRRLQLSQKTVISNLNISNVEFFKKVFKTKGVLLSLLSFDKVKHDNIKKYHKEFGFELTANIEYLNLDDYEDEYLQIEDNDLITQFPSKIATDNIYMNEVLKSGIILKKVK